MKVNPRSCDPIVVNGEAIEEVQDFTYLGSNISRDGGADRDMKLQAFRILRPIWLSSQLSTNTKIQIFNTNVKSVLLYGSETWKTTKSLQSKLQVFVNKCLPYILKIWWPNKITSEELWRKTNQTRHHQYNKKTKVELDRSHSPEGQCNKHHKTGTRLQPTGEKETRQAQKQLEPFHPERP